MPARASQIHMIEPSAHTDKQEGNQVCFTTQINGLGIVPDSGPCDNLGYSGWEELTIAGGSDSTMVSGQFKNWGSTTKTALLWVKLPRFRGL